MSTTLIIKSGNKPIINGQHFVLMAAFFYGLNPFFAQLLFKEGFTAEMVSLYRFILPALFFTFFLRTPQAHWSEAFRTLLLGIASGISIFGYFHALDTLPAATAILIYYTYPVFSVLIGWAVFKRRPTQNAWVAAALIAIAASLTVRPETLSADLLLSVVGCFLAPLMVATQVQYLSNPRRPIPTMNRMAWITSGHIIVLLPIAIWSAPVQVLPVSLTGALSILGIALLAAAIPQILFMLGAPRSSVDKNALMGSLEFVVALLTGAVLLGENIDRLEMAAMLLIVLALFIKQVENKPAAAVVVG
ncbi:DMT family transporter [Neptunomonas qingdaonensis]|uniref:Threonine/homoserine efflux transporter RhtA n=1 Tax=Neptunomonas qingdaonensis TaxID=1045558 RepID=A0A1I2P0F0_9GAMM|nr:DMT family transporter [Neptunomonas qingdaonensis]SFG09554.1 Threonine/homoserine efflux transporter RhtA [Neptunomonas qingdaonensis]